MTQNIQTGIPKLDEALPDLYQPGNTTLIAGPSGAGASVLANQIASEALRGGFSVTFVGRLVEPYETFTRLLSLRTGLAMDDLRDNTAQIVLEAREELSSQMNSGHLTLYSCDLMDTLNFLPHLRQNPPRVLVVDQIERSTTKKYNHAYEVSRHIEQLAISLKTFATDTESTVLATAHVSHNSRISLTKVTPNLVYECKTLDSIFDNFIGISLRQATTEDKGLADVSTGIEPLNSKTQYLNVIPPRGTKPTKVPVSIDFDHATFEPSDHDPDQACADPVTGETDEEKVIAIKKKSAFPGWIPMRRHGLKQVLSLRSPEAVAVYVLLGLRADAQPPKGRPKGSVFLGVDPGMTSILGDGFSRAIVRTALKNLEDLEVIKRTTAKVRRSIVRIVKTVAQGAETATDDYEEGGYFRLHRNLLDDDRIGLLKNARLLTAWMTCLLHARFKDAPEEGLNAGEFQFHLEQFRPFFPEKTPNQEILDLMTQLKREGRLQIPSRAREDTVDDKDYYRVANWTAYQDHRLKW